ncbi:hypothetical protein DFH94DRAFT_693454 [Russula ochroleuca]|uniref:Uncharacterized protein n=1 Tax=Russula ochroleuca TaxID=152965 RepID=A0A9P5MUE5_9AGAM|nr:hypothetical protein DFH94DRAFT_693454 [Russula ochroleuca]
MASQLMEPIPAEHVLFTPVDATMLFLRLLLQSAMVFLGKPVDVDSTQRIFVLAPLDPLQEAAETAGVHVMQLMEDASVLVVDLSIAVTRSHAPVPVPLPHTVVHHLNDVEGGDSDAVDDRFLRFFTKFSPKRQANRRFSVPSAQWGGRAKDLGYKGRVVVSDN